MACFTLLSWRATEKRMKTLIVLLAHVVQIFANPNEDQEESLTRELRLQLTQANPQAGLAAVLPIHRRQAVFMRDNEEEFDGSGAANTHCSKLNSQIVWTQAEALNYVINCRHGAVVSQGSANIALNLSMVDMCSGIGQGAAGILAAAMTSSSGRNRLCPDNVAGAESLQTMLTIVESAVELVRPLSNSLQLPTISLSSPPEQQLHGSGRDDFVLAMQPGSNTLSAVLADVMTIGNWESVLVISAADEPIQPGEMLHAALSDRNVCIARQVQFNGADSASVKLAVDVIVEFPRVNVIILLATSTSAEVLFQHLVHHQRNRTSNVPLAKKLWIGAGSWATGAASLDRDFNLLTQGAIFINPDNPANISDLLQQLQAGYKHHLKCMDLASIGMDIANNPWLLSAWEERLNCSVSCLLRANDTETACQSQKACLPGYRLSESDVLAIVDGARRSLLAAQLAVEALNQLLLDYQTCPGLMTPFNARDFLRFATPARMRAALWNVTATLGGANEKASSSSVFSPLQSAESYSISTVANQSLVKIGEWSEAVGFWMIPGHDWHSRRNITLSDTSAGVNVTLVLPLSTCRVKRCPDQYEPGPVLTGASVCCTVCVHCNHSSYSNGSQCILCDPLMLKVNINGTGCELKDFTVTLKITGVLPALCIAISLLGLIFTGVNFCIFGKYRRNHISRAADVNLIFVLLAGMLPGYVGLAFFVAPPDPNFCVIRLALSRLSILITTSAVLVKTSRMARLAIKSQKLRLNTNDRTMRQPAQFFFVLAVVVVGCGILASLLKVNYAQAILDGTDFICVYPGPTIHVSDAYIMCLLVASVILAMPLRRLPKGYNRTWLVLMMALCMTLVYIISSVNVYLSRNNLPVVFVVRLFLLMHAAWLAVCYTPLRLLLDEFTSSRLSSLTNSKASDRSGRSCLRHLSPADIPSTSGYPILGRSGSNGGSNGMTIYSQKIKAENVRAVLRTPSTREHYCSHTDCSLPPVSPATSISRLNSDSGLSSSPLPRQPNLASPKMSSPDLSSESAPSEAGALEREEAADSLSPPLPSPHLASNSGKHTQAPGSTGFSFQCPISTTSRLSLSTDLRSCAHLAVQSPGDTRPPRSPLSTPPSPRKTSACKLQMSPVSPLADDGTPGSLQRLTFRRTHAMSAADITLHSSQPHARARSNTIDATGV